LFNRKAAKAEFLSFLIFSLSLTLLLIVVQTPTTFANADPNYTYYGVVPERLWRYNLSDYSDRDSEWVPRGDPATLWLLTIAASEDNTNIVIYNLTYNQPVSEIRLNSMQKHFVTLRNGTFFKVTSDKPVSVLLLNYGGEPLANATTGQVPNTFYPATDGAYVGKEFVFMASQRLERSFTIFALETAEVTITTANETSRTLTLDPNSYEKVFLNAWRVYKVESTGYIMIQSGGPDDDHNHPHFGFTVPSSNGGFLGNAFYTVSHSIVDWNEDCGFRISAPEDAEVTVYHLETKEVLYQFSVEGGGGVGFQAMAPAIAVQSSNPIMLMFVHNGSIERSLGGGIYGSYGAGVVFIGVRPDEGTPFYLPMDSSVKAYIYASEDTQITIDSFSQTIPADFYYLYTQRGTHTIRANKKVVVQLLFWPFEPEYQGLGNNDIGEAYPGTAVPCIETVDVTHDVTLTPLGEAFPIMYVIVGVAVAAVAVVAVLLLRRR
jgi:hypothetical protein